jgi:tetratricopeptide (TPR) repeat protein
MKYQILSCILLYASFLYTDPLVVAVLMVKNEEPVMQKTLQPLVDAGIKSFFVYDTGSIDNTIEVTRTFFADNNISDFVIVQEPWIDFAASRNRALELTQHYFPHAIFMLMLDAEWILHGGEQLLQFCQQLKNHHGPVYSIMLHGLAGSFGHARLIRCKAGVYFVGKIHEIPNFAPTFKLPDGIYFDLAPTHYGQEKTRQRWLRDRDLLLQQVEENPDDSRAVFYLAQTYFCLEDWTNAIKWFEKRSAMLGWAEEDFFATYVLAQTYLKVGDVENMIVTNLKAFQMRPIRAEPLIRIAEYFYHKESYYLAYLFARHACTIPYPNQEHGLVEVRLYKFLRYDLLGATAYFVGDYALGEQAIRKALEVAPDMQHLHDNLKMYQEMLM